LETFQDFDVGSGSRTPELDSISPYRFQDGFVEQDFVAELKMALASYFLFHSRMHRP
jgi:hypothetical protein